MSPCARFSFTVFDQAPVSVPSVACPPVSSDPFGHPTALPHAPLGLPGGLRATHSRPCRALDTGSSAG